MLQKISNTNKLTVKGSVLRMHVCKKVKFLTEHPFLLIIFANYAKSVIFLNILHTLSLSNKLRSIFKILYSTDNFIKVTFMQKPLLKRLRSFLVTELRRTSYRTHRYAGLSILLSIRFPKYDYVKNNGFLYKNIGFDYCF